MTPPGRMRLSESQARRKVVGALALAGSTVHVDVEGLASAPEDLIRRLPTWVGRFGWLESRGIYFLWCELIPSTDERFSSQVVLELPAGRYFVEALDADTGSWISRESAAGGPLVAGLPFTGGAVLVLVRPHPGRSPGR